MGEEVIIDLTNTPLKPIGKKEINQLEMALIVGTLYRPEILELIKDPIERATWMDSLAVAAAAFARYKANIPISEIAEDLGRSETTIRSHLNQKTKAGKLIAETYEKIKRGELKLIAPFARATAMGIEEVQTLRSEVESLREQNRLLESQVNTLKQEIEDLKKQLTLKELEITNLKAELEKSIREKEDLMKKIRELVEEAKRAKELILETLKTVERLATTF